MSFDALTINLCSEINVYRI